MYQLRQHIQPFTIFWIGVLTGALVITTIFLYRLYSDVGAVSTLGPKQTIQRQMRKAPKIQAAPRSIGDGPDTRSAAPQRGSGVQIGDGPDT